MEAIIAAAANMQKHVAQPTLRTFAKRYVQRTK
jgi:hypothetical protein